MDKLIGFWNSDFGRRCVKGVTVAFGALVSGGVIPLDMAIGPFTVGQILMFLGVMTPTGQLNKPS
jgi:hypothetical protein